MTVPSALFAYAILSETQVVFEFLEIYHTQNTGTLIPYNMCLKI